MHYFCDWLYENEQRGVLEIISGRENGELLPMPVNFMTAHRTLYPKLQEEKTFQALRQTETAINQRVYYYTPKSRVAGIEKIIRDGDIIAITAAARGLDIIHCGFAARLNGRVYLLHASSDFNKVMLTKEPLAAYLQRNPSQSGIIIARVKE